MPSEAVALSLLVPSAEGHWGWEAQPSPRALCELMEVTFLSQLVALGLTCGQQGEVPCCPCLSCLGLCRCSQHSCDPPEPASSTFTAMKLVLMRRQGEPSSAL